MAGRSPDRTLSATAGQVHREWNNALDPVATVSPGATVSFDCPDAREGQFELDTTLADLKAMDHDAGLPLVGPVAVEGASPGDVLEVDILEVEHGDIGWTMIYPGDRGVGLLAEEFPEWGLHVWDLSDGVGRFVDGIEVPLAPFPGTIGLAPGAEGAHDTTPPRAVGGNLDTKYLTEGATLYLPVEAEGALFSVGDGHAAQGDGEVCGGAIETPIELTCRFELHTDRSIGAPRYRPGVQPPAPGSTFATTGVRDDLMAAAAEAVSELVEHLVECRGLPREKAYILCSVAADLKITELVDEPNYVVAAHLREDVFPTASDDG